MSEDKQDVAEDLKEEQERAQEIFDLLSKEPKMRLAPFLRFTEQGVYPDVKLVKATNDEDKGDNGASEEPEGEGKER